jgi:hypothetical protein
MKKTKPLSHISTLVKEGEKLGVQKKIILAIQHSADGLTSPEVLKATGFNQVVAITALWHLCQEKRVKKVSIKPFPQIGPHFRYLIVEEKAKAVR